MMDNDSFLDWLEEKRDTHDIMGHEQTSGVISDLIVEFNSEFDTRDSPYVTPNPNRQLKKKPKRTG